MTIVLGINFGDYVLLAADTRAFMLDLSNHPYGVCNDHEKISKTNIGIMAGRGSDRLLELVNSKFNEIDEIISTDDLKRVVNNERQHFRELYPDFAEQSIKSTAWIFSYLTFGEGTFNRGTPALRLGVIGYAGDIIGRPPLHNNYPFVVPPPEATEQDASIIINALKTLIKPIDQFKTRSESVHYHWQVIAKSIQIIKRLKKSQFHSISSSCQIGIHTLDGFTGVSSILKDTDTTASITLNPPPQPRSIISTLEQLTTLTSEAYGFRITYPETWKIEEASSVYDPIRVRIFLPTGDYADAVSVAMYSLEPNTSLDEVIKYNLNDIRNLNDCCLISERNSTIANHPSYTEVFQGTVPVQLSETNPVAQAIIHKAKQIYAVNSNMLYVITYKTALDKYNKYLAVAQRVMNSFAFVRRSNTFELIEHS